jgi:uncharacterized MnhB-related membrane protein
VSAPVIRWSIWALPLAGIFIALSWVYDPGGRLVLTDPDGYARAVTSTFYIVEGYSSLIGFVLLLFGLVALYGHLSSLAASPWNTAGMILSVAGAALLLPVYGVIALADPVLGDVYLSGHPDVAAAMVPLSGGNFSARLIAYFVVVVLICLAGAITTAVAIWGSAVLPRRAGILIAVAYLLTAASFPPVALIGALLLAVIGTWLALRIRRESSAAAMTRVRPAPA